MRRIPSKKNRIIALFREDETSSFIIANKIHSPVAYVNVVKNELLRELRRSHKA